MFRLLLLLLMISLSGCGCIEAGKGFSNNSIEVRVPVKPNGASRGRPVTYWVNSGYKLEEDIELKITVDHSVNLCPRDAKMQAITVKMFPESLFTSDFRPEFYDTHVDVVKGDRIIFSPAPYTVAMPGCSDMNSMSSIIRYENNTFYKDNSCKQGIPASDICASGIQVGGEVYVKVNNKCEKLSNTVEIPREGGKVAETPRHLFPLGYATTSMILETSKNVANIYSDKMIANRRFYDAREIKINTPEITQEVCDTLKKAKLHASIPGTLSDIMATKGTSSYAVKSINSTPTRTPPRGHAPGAAEKDKADKANEVLKHYTEYDISCHCGLICSPSDNVSSDCIRTVVTVSDGKLVCPTPKDLTSSELSKQITSVDPSKIDMKSLEKYVNNNLPIADSSRAVYELAEGAIAAIYPNYQQGKTDVSKDKCNNCLWLPDRVRGLSESHGTFSEKSLRMSHIYEAPESGRLFLTYLQPSQYRGNSIHGFYSINVNRTCYAVSGKYLYMYIGDSAPTSAPGDAADHVELDLEAQNPKGMYTLNKKSDPNKKKGNLYFGIKIDPRYDNQLEVDEENYYSVRLWVPTWEPGFSKLFTQIQGTIMRVLYGIEVSGDIDIPSAVNKALKSNKKGAIQHIYDNQVTSRPFWFLIRAVLVLYLMFSVLGYILGVVQVTKYDLVVRIAKIALIISLFSQGSWKFFNEHLFSIFITGTSDIIAAFNGFLDGDRSFKFLDSTLGILLTSELWIRLLSLIVAGPVGWLAFAGIIWALFVFFAAMLKAVIMYLFTIMGIAFLVSLAPIFITFLLFQVTRGMFDSWLKMLVNFSLQPIILFASLAFLNQVVLTALHSVTDFTACESCAVGIRLPSENKDDSKPSRPDICLLPLMLPVGFSNELSLDDRQREILARGDIGFLGLPFGVTIVLVLIVVCNAIRDFERLAEVMAHSISGSVAGVTASVVGATQSMLGVVGLDNASQNIIRSARRMTPSGEGKLEFEGKGEPRAMSRGVPSAGRDEATGDENVSGDRPADRDNVTGAAPAGSDRVGAGSRGSVGDDSVSGSGKADDTDKLSGASKEKTYGDTVSGGSKGQTDSDVVSSGTETRKGHLTPEGKIPSLSASDKDIDHVAGGSLGSARGDAYESRGSFFDAYKEQDLLSGASDESGGPTIPHEGLGHEERDSRGDLKEPSKSTEGVSSPVGRDSAYHAADESSDLRHHKAENVASTSHETHNDFTGHERKGADYYDVAHGRDASPDSSDGPSGAEEDLDKKLNKNGDNAPLEGETEKE